MSVKFFDSNVILYMFDESAPEKLTLARSLVHSGIAMEDSAISYQVVQESLNVLTKSSKFLSASKEVDQFLTKTLEPLWKVNPSIKLYKKAFEIKSRYRYSFYDSLIIAAAIEVGCETLYSEDMQDGQTIEQLTIRNPFRN